VEPDEGFTITISNPGSNETITTSTANGTVENDDTSLSIAVNSAVKAEGDSGSTAFTFTVTREGDATGETSVDYAVTGSGGNPAGAADFGGTLPLGTINFTDNETSKIVTVNVSGDTDIEPDETFTITLSNPTNDATIATATAAGTIEADDNSIDLASLDGGNGFTLHGSDYGDRSGRSVSNAGDINNDGFDDMIIGANEADPDDFEDAGESYVVFGGEYGVRGWDNAGSSLDLKTLTPTNGFTIKGIDEDDHSGWSVSSAGDINNDGFDDLIIGAYRADPDGDSDAGESYVVFGGEYGVRGLSHLYPGPGRTTGGYRY
jgi:hypothetical protein